MAGSGQSSQHKALPPKAKLFTLRKVAGSLFHKWCQCMMIVALLAAPIALIAVEFCSSKPEPAATEPPEWHWRMVDGKKCYFRADKLLPREDLVWSYDAKQFDLNEGATVKGRRHYTLRELKAIAAVKRSTHADEQPLPKRKKIRPRRKRVNDED